MNRKSLFLTALLLLTAFLVMSQEPKKEPPKEDSAAYINRMKWFGDAKLGIIIH